jgi:hypothetical protein
MPQHNVRLRLEAGDGSATKEYRVDDGRVEVRSWQPHIGYDAAEHSWHQLTPEQLSTHVERNTVVAQWLERRLGWRRLLQACASQEPHSWTATTQGWKTEKDYIDRHAA